MLEASWSNDKQMKDYWSEEVAPYLSKDYWAEEVAPFLEEEEELDWMQRLRRKLPQLAIELKRESPAQEIVSGFAKKGLEKWRESDYPITAEMTKTPSSEFYGMTENERAIANIGRTAHALPRFPIDIAQKVFFTEEKKFRPPLGVGKEAVKTGVELVEWGRGVLGDYMTYISPLSTPEQRRQSIENIATDPGGLFFVIGIAKGGLKGGQMLKGAVKRFMKKKGKIIEEPPAERVTAITDERIQELMTEREFAKERGEPSIFEKAPVLGEAELKLARELREKGVTEKPAEIPAANIGLNAFLDYFEDIQAPVGFRPPRKPARVAIRERLREEGLTGKELTHEANVEFIKAVQDYNIALRKTGTGKIQPAIRKAGTYVPEDFATYTEFKDAKAGVFGGTKDATRFIQEIDGALSVEAKTKLPGQAGPAEQYVLHRTRDMVKFKLNWTRDMKARLATITKGLSKEQTQIANQVIEHISREGAYVDPAKLVTNPKISALTTDVSVIRLAQEGRKLYESLLRHQNEARRLRGQTEIPHRDYYTAHSIHETTIWERALGHNKTPEQIVGPGLPDYIKPNAPFNPRAVAREIGLPETVREMNLSVLLERYIETAAKDIYNTSIVQNNKAFIQQLKSMGYEHAARGLENWTAEAFGGVRGAVDRVANLSPTVHKGMNRFRQGLLRSVFPLNFAWNTFVQTSSGVLTVTRFGVRNSVRGLYDWFGSKKIRQEIRDNAYSAIIKSQRSGRISQQDINRGIGAAERLNRGRLEKVSDAANFFTEWVERHLTGWSVATAKRHGASAGLKGKPLWEYASDGGAKTQSMYNLEDLPGMLRSEVVKTGAPFQTFSFEIYNTCREFAGKTGTPPATATIRTKQVLRFLAGATAVNYIGQAAIGRKPWELSSFIPFYGTFIAPVSAAIRGEDVSMTTTRGLPSPVGIAIKGGQALHKGFLKPGFAATKELVKTRDFKAALKEFIATGKWDKLRRFTIRYLSAFAGFPGGTQMNRIVDGLIATSAGGMIDSADRMMFPITDTKDKIRSFLAGPWATKGGQDYWDKRGGEIDLDIEFLEQNPLLRDVIEGLPVVGDFYEFKKNYYKRLAEIEKKHGVGTEWMQAKKEFEDLGYKFNNEAYLEYKRNNP